MKDQLKFVQILRGFAAIAVLLFHLDVYAQQYFRYSLFSFNFGYLGLHFFFALTGFIITYVHLRETQNKSSVKKFLLKRFVRIYPFYWLVMIITIGLQSPEFYDKPTLRSALDPGTTEGITTIVKNIFLYPLPESHMPVGIAWGLSHAVLFYLLFALAIKLKWQAAKYIFGAWILIIRLGLFIPFPPHSLLQLLTSPLNLQILTGCFAGYVFVKNKIPITTSYFADSFLVLAVLFAAFIYWQGFDTNNIFVALFMGSISSLVLYYAASLDMNKQYRNYASPFFIITGDAAYSIILTHIIFIPYICIVLNKILNVPVVPAYLKVVLIILVLILAVIAGVLTYLMIERPVLNFLRKKLRLKRQKIVWT